MMNLNTIKEYVLENVDLMQLVQEINSYNGSLEDLCFYENDEYFFETFFDGKPLEAVRAAHYGDYRYMDDYVNFNAYGNLVSVNAWQLDEMLKDSIDEIMEELVNEWYHLYLDTDLQEMLEEMEENEG